MAYYAGVDLSYTGTGLIVLDQDHVEVRETYKSKLRGDERLREIVFWIGNKLRDYKCDAWATEAPSYGSPFNTVALGELHGAFRLARLIGGLSRPWYISPMTLKKFATGAGKGDKSNVKMCVLEKWGEKFMGDDECDAYVIARIAGAIHGGLPAKHAYEKECVKAVVGGTLNVGLENQ